MAANNSYTTRESYYEAMYHQFDDLKNTGYDWQNNLMNRSLSAYLLSDRKRQLVVNRYQLLLVYIVNYVSNIKKAVFYSADKNYKYIN